MRLPVRFLMIIFLFSILSSEASDLKFYSINQEHGISVRGANSVCKDQDGFIWASAKSCVLRLTNDDYRVYNLPFNTPAFYYIGLVQKDNTLLAYTNNGQLFKYNLVADRFELQVDLGQYLKTQYIIVAGVLIDPSENYWIATSNGLFRYKDNTVNEISIGGKGIDAMVWLDDDHIVMVAQGEIQRINIHDQESKVLYKEALSTRLQTRSLFLDKEQNRLWIGSNSSGLFYLDINQNTFHPSGTPYLPGQPILCIEPNGENKLLLGIDGQGVWEVDRRNGQVLRIYKEDDDNPNSLPGNGVYDILNDPENNRVWVCTISGGVSYFDQASSGIIHITRQANNYNSLANNHVNSVIEDRHGDLWFATNNGISCWRKEKNSWDHFYKNTHEQAQVFLTLCEDDQGRIWSGTYASGIYVLDRKSGKQVAKFAANQENSPISNNFIFDIRKGKSGDIWIGGINCEIVNYKTKENRFEKYATQPVSVLCEYSDDLLLVGCSYGLCQLTKTSGELKVLVDSCMVNDILVCQEKIWVATSGAGLICLDPKTGTLERFTTENGLPSNMVNSIGYSNNSIWLGTEGGLCQLDLSKTTVILFSYVPVLANSSFNSKAFFKLNCGKLAWGTNKGVVIFDPLAIKQEQPCGKIFLQDIKVSGRSIRDIPSFHLSKPLNELQKINLKYTQKNLSIELLPIGATYGSKISWKMEGLDDEWSVPAKHRVLHFANLPGKKLNLRIRMYDNSLLNLLDERIITIKISPPLWGTWWFLIVSFILISSIIYASIWYYISFLKQRQAEEKVRFITNTAHDIRNSISLIKAPVEELCNEPNMSDEGMYYVRLAKEQAGRLSSVVTQLMDFQKIDIGKERLVATMIELVKFISDRKQMFEFMAKSRNIDIAFTYNRTSYITAVDEAKMEKIIDNLISNAIKYSYDGSQVHIDLYCEDVKWTLQVKDHGIGISNEAQRLLFKEFHRGENAINSKIIGSGIGLLLVKKYTAMHDGKISCISQENVGSTFKLVVPHKDIVSSSIAHNNEIQAIVNDVRLTISQEKEDDPGLKEMKVLIVDDNDDLRGFIFSALGKKFEVVSAQDGEIAWEYIKNNLPDLVVSDVLMPNMDGFRLCELIKSTYETSHIPIILLTGLSEKTEQLHGLGLGADDYLTKPFDMNLLERKIVSIIRNREAVREKAVKLIKLNKSEPLLSNELNDKFIKDMLDVVRANIPNSDFSKELFARAMNMSPSLLYKKIKALTGQSPVDFIKTARLYHALELLQSRKYSITEVSELCGYTSLAYFSNVFKKHFGKSPSEIL